LPTLLNFLFSERQDISLILKFISQKRSHNAHISHKMTSWARKQRATALSQGWRTLHTDEIDMTKVPFFDEVTSKDIQQVCLTELCCSGRSLRAHCDQRHRPRRTELQIEITALERQLESKRSERDLDVVFPAQDVHSQALPSESACFAISDATFSDNPMVLVTDSFCSLTGYTRRELFGLNARFLEGPDTDPQAAGRIRQAVQSGTEIFETVLNYKADGTSFWVQIFLSPLRSGTGRVEQFISLYTEVPGPEAPPRPGPEAAESAAASAAEDGRGGRTRRARPGLKVNTAYSNPRSAQHLSEELLRTESLASSRAFRCCGRLFREQHQQDNTAAQESVRSAVSPALVPRRPPSREAKEGKSVEDALERAAKHQQMERPPSQPLPGGRRERSQRRGGGQPPSATASERVGLPSRSSHFFATRGGGGSHDDERIFPSLGLGSRLAAGLAVDNAGADEGQGTMWSGRS